MSISSIKKILLAGTALVAVAGFGAQAQATSGAQTLSAAAIWGVAGNGITDAGSGSTLPDSVVGSTYLLTITNNGTANDGSANTNTFNVGTIGGSTGGFSSVVGSTNNLAVTIASGVFTGAAPIIISNSADAAYANATTVTGALSNTGAGILNVTNAGTASAVSLTVGGDISIGGATTVTGGTAAGEVATLTLNGAGTNTFTGGLTLTNGAAGHAGLNVTGTAAQTVAGAITGNGDIIVDNAAGATFSGTTTAGTITIDKGAGNSSATFQNTVTAPITLGAAAGTVNGVTFGTATTGDTNTVVFDSTTQGFTVTDAIAGANATQTNNISVIGGNTVVQATASTANLNNLAISGTATLNSAANLTVAATTIGSGATLDTTAGTLTSAVTDNGTLQMGGGAVTGNVSGTGLLNVTASGTLTGNLTTTGTSTIAASQILTATGNITGGAITSAASGTLDIDGPAAQTVSDTYATGILTVGDGTTASNATFSGALSSLASLNVDAAAKATFNATTSVTGALTNAGTATIDTGETVTAASVASTGTVDFQVKNTSASVTGGTTGELISGGAGGATSVSTIGVTVSSAQSGFIKNDSVFEIITAGTGTLTSQATATGYSLGLVGLDKYYAVLGGSTPIATGALAGITPGGTAADVFLVAVQQSASTLGSAITANDSAEYNGLATVSTTLAGVGSPNAAETQLIAAINAVDAAASTSATATHNALQALMPAGVDGGAQNAALTVGAETQGIANTRMASLRSGDDPTSGVAAGASANGVSMWIEGYGQHANQDTDDGVNGYNANTWGGAVGVDSSSIFDKAIVGFALNYGHSAISSSDANSTNTDLGNYGLNLYGTYDLGDKMFVNGQVGFAYNTIDSDRYNVGPSNLTATGSTSSDQYSARLDAGRDYPAGNGLTLTPDLSAAYTYLDTAGYTESGAGGLDNTVASNSQNNLGLGIGGTASWKIVSADEDVLKPALHAGYTYEAVDDKVQTSSSFAGDPASTIFINEGASPARSIFDVGAKIVYSTKANWDLSANYDFQIKQDYTSNTGEIRATAHF